MSKRKHAIEETFRHAARLHAAGRLPEAEQLYRQILSAAPRHADSLHMLGVLALQAGQPQAAVALIDQAIAVQPSGALYHVNRAASLHALGRSDDALAACRVALRHKRNCAEAYQALGHIESDLGRPDAAIDAYREALRHKPDLPDGANNLGLALREANRFEDAAAIFQDALRLTRRRHRARQSGRRAEGSRPAYRGRDAVSRGPVPAPRRPGVALQPGRIAAAGRQVAEGWTEWEWRLARVRPPRRP